ncbi:hypothetical protein [Actinoplanes awajinensis]|uniref:hypothetical protein n=1 Tax=Actinoplanes awajinensis TaxID=135946 RepID=UPI001E29545A|nr:hypothetical protein [Actinoplanes awajinensis]
MTFVTGLADLVRPQAPVAAGAAAAEAALAAGDTEPLGATDTLGAAGVTASEGPAEAADVDNEEEEAEEDEVGDLEHAPAATTRATATAAMIHRWPARCSSAARMSSFLIVLSFS